MTMWYVRWRIVSRADSSFEEMGLVGADYFVSAIGPAFEVFAQYSAIVKLSGEEVDVPSLWSWRARRLPGMPCGAC